MPGQTYVERPPLQTLRRLVSSVWVQRVAPDAPPCLPAAELVDLTVDADQLWGQRRRPDGRRRAYQNFPDPELPAKAYYGTNHDRLLRVRQTYDPYRFFGS